MRNLFFIALVAAIVLDAVTTFVALRRGAWEENARIRFLTQRAGPAGVLLTHGALIAGVAAVALFGGQAGLWFALGASPAIWLFARAAWRNVRVIRRLG
jgi:hypothetical protein